MTLPRPLLLASVLLACFGLAALADSPVRLQVNGEWVATEVPPQVIEGTTFLPLRAIATALGAELHWEPKTKTACLCVGTVCHRICVSDPESRARIVNGRTLVPLRRIAQMLGCQVEWDGEARAVRVTAPRDQTPTPTHTSVER